MEYRDYYKTLGVGRQATPAEIKKAYRRLARELHPDRNPGDKTAEKRFKEVNEANEVLGDPAKRQQYDMLGANWEQFGRAGGAAGGAAGNPFGPGGPFAGFGGMGGQSGNVRYEFHTVGGQGGTDFSDFFNAFFGGGMPAQGPAPAGRVRGGSGGSSGGSGSRGNPLEDLMSRLRGNETAAAGRARGGAGGGRDAQAEVEISLEEAFGGSSRLVQAGARRLEVKVPRGVETGSKIRLRGKAGDGPDAGDLYLIVKVLPHSVFTRNGADLTREVPITLGEALLGAEVDVPTLGGRIVLKIPAGTQPGQTFRLAGQGMPHLRGEGSGDLFAKVKVVLPDKLDGRRQKAAQELVRTIDQPNPRQH